MGSEYEVWVWVPDGSDWKYEPYASCERLDQALEYMHAAKRDGYKCIKLEWRPRD